MEVISVVEFQKIKGNSFLLDVRTSEEYEIANIGGTLIPLDQLTEKVSELPKEKKIYCLCHHGMRSMHAAMFLNSHGYQAVNIEGGIDAWSNVVDPSIPKY